LARNGRFVTLRADVSCSARPHLDAELPRMRGRIAGLARSTMPDQVSESAAR
jgi:hypothetical protein